MGILTVKSLSHNNQPKNNCNDLVGDGDGQVQVTRPKHGPEYSGEDDKGYFGVQCCKLRTQVFIYYPKIMRFDVFRIIFWSLELKTHPSFA